MDIKIVCPLGAECETVKDGYVERCAWYTKLVGKDPQSNKEYDDWRCAIAWQPIMSVEVAQTNRGQTATLVSFRNETVKGQETFNNILATAVNRKAIGE